MLDNNSWGNQNYLIYCDDMVGFNEQDEYYIEVIKHEVGNKETLEDMPLKELELLDDIDVYACANIKKEKISHGNGTCE